MKRPMTRMFKPNFRRIFNRKDASGYDSWPTQDQLNRWYQDRRDKGEGLKNGVIGKMKRGEPVSEWLCLGTIEFLMQDPATLFDSPRRSLALDLDRKRALLFSYLRDLEVSEPESRKPIEVIDKICTQPSHGGRFVDAYKGGLQIMRDFLSLPRLSSKPWTFVALCEKKQIKEVVRWIFVEVGRALASPETPTETAIDLAKSHMQIDRDEYAQLLESWITISRWTVILGLFKNEPVGVGIALPVSAPSYEHIRSGMKMSYRCTAEDFHVPSSDIIFEALAFRPREERSVDFNATQALLLASMCQAAFLSTLPEISVESPLRFLAFAGTPQNEKRIKWLGYEPTGTFQYATKIPFLERKLELDPTRSRPSRDFRLNLIWFSLQRYLRTKEANEWFKQFQ